MRNARSLAPAVVMACGVAAVQPGSAFAQPASAAQDEEIIVTLRTNQVARGEFSVLRTRAGDFWILARDMPRLKMAPPESARREYQGERYFSLQALGATRVVFTEADLSLAVDLPAGQFQGTSVDLSSRPPPAPITPAQNSAIMNYRVAARQAAADAPLQLVMTTDLNVRVGEVLLRQEAKVETGRAAPPFSRGLSQLVWDNRLKGQRVVAGDQLTLGGPFGTSITAAGVSVSRIFDITPDMLRQPTPSVALTASTPSQVEVTVDGSPVYRATVAPGPVNLQNLFYMSGARTVRVTLTDASGHRQVVEQAFLFTDSALAPGVHEYSYFAGKRSLLAENERWRYLEGVAQGYHRYGLNNYVTLEGSAEGTSDLAAAAAGLTLRTDAAGLVAMAALGSVNRGGSRSGQGWSARYTYLSPYGSLVLGRRQVSPGYRNLAATEFAPQVLSETRAALSTQLGDWGNLSMDWSRVRDTASTRSSYALRTATYVNRRTLLTGELVRTRATEGRDWSLNFYLRYELERQQWVGATARAGPNFHSLDLETGKQVDQGEGLGYRVGTSSLRTGDVAQTFAYANANWNLKSATLEFNGSSQVHGGNASFYEAAVSGAVVGIQGFVGATRQVPDSFALARLGVGQAGVDVSLNSQVQGKTDARGMLLIPNVGAFGRQDVSIDDKQLPMQFNLASRRVTIAPPYRSGTVVDFGARRLRALTGQVWLADGTGRKPLTSRALMMRAEEGSASVRVETALEGDFYLEDAPPGRYAGRVELGGRQYSCRMDIPEFSEEVHELKEGVVCE